MDGLTASALAREVGISKATVFHHFPKLDEVPIAALDVLSDMIIPQGPDETADLEEFLHAFGAASLNLFGTQGGIVHAYFSFLTKAMFEPRLKAKLVAGMDGAVARLTLTLTRMIDDAARADELARICLTTMDGMMISAALTGDASVQAALWRRMAKLLAKEYGHANRN